MGIKSTGMHHLALCTKDMEATVQFWSKIMGCPVVTTLHLPPVDPFAGLTWGDLADKKHYFFDIGNGDRVAFFDLKEETPETKDQGFAHHVALGVESEQALADAKTHLEQHNVKVSDIVDHLFCKSIYFRDPNGVFLEYSVYTGDWTFETPFLQDANPVPAARAQFGDRYDKELRHFTAGHVDTYVKAEAAAR